MGIKTYGFRPGGDRADNILAASSRRTWGAIEDQMSPNCNRHSNELDDLLRQGASEAEIAAWRAKSEAEDEAYDREVERRCRRVTQDPVE